MQVFGLHKNIYRLGSYALTQEKRERCRARFEEPVKKWEWARKRSRDPEISKAVSEISRATYYRYKARLREIDKGILPPTKRPKTLRKPQWGEAERQLVLRLRRENPTYGKAKIAVIFRRDHGATMSESTVGRIIKFLMGKGLIHLSVSALRPKRKRRFKGHAQPWLYGMKGTKLGELVQIDHMTVSKNQVSGKHFQAWSPVGRYINANIYSNATSSIAKRFLKELIRECPFKITSIQVDGGSEFMKDFEGACKELDIKLYVLPPRRPQYNGGVERGNRIFREEFYARKDLLADSIGALRAELKRAQLKYNSYRPHHALKGQTPMAYIQNILEPAA